MLFDVEFEEDGGDGDDGDRVPPNEASTRSSPFTETRNRWPSAADGARPYSEIPPPEDESVS